MLFFQQGSGVEVAWRGRAREEVSAFFISWREVFKTLNCDELDFK